MKHNAIRSLAVTSLVLALAATPLSGCAPTAVPAPIASSSASAASQLKVMAVTTFLADMARNVAGDRATVEALMPIGADLHAFQPTPQDMARISECDVLVINGAGLEEWLEDALRNTGGSCAVVEASAGLEARIPDEDEEAESAESHDDEHHPEQDPHFWLDPISVMTYARNLRDAFSRADPAGAQDYAADAEVYIAQLAELDAWIREQIAGIPEAKRLLVTNHMSFGYFADRYDLRIVGSILPGTSTVASPSARELADLVARIRDLGVVAVFLETGTNPQLAEQLARETGVRVVYDLYTHSLTDAAGPAPTYIAMMRHNTAAIAAALR